MIKPYYKNGDSATAIHNRSTTQTIGKIAKKFVETEVVISIRRPVHYRFACSAENIAIVSESAAQDPNMWIPRRSQQLGLSHGTLWRILHLYLHLHPHKVLLTTTTEAS